MNTESLLGVTANPSDVNITGLTGQKGFGFFIPSEDIVSNAIRSAIEKTISIYTIPILCLIGIIANSTTIAVFYKQGYKETINISLTAIALWDLSKCFCGTATALRAPIRTLSPVLESSYGAYTTWITGYTSTFCTYVSSVLAGYVAVERCLCVSLPFTVKYLISPKVVTSVMIILSILIFGSCAVMYPIHKIQKVYSSRYNAVVSRLMYGEIYYKYPILFQFYNVISFVWPALSLLVQCISTLIIIHHLRMSSKFRSESSSGNTKTVKEEKPKETITPRDRRVMKMLLVVIVVYIVNLFPRLTLAVARSVIPGFYVFTDYHNLYAICMWFEILFDFINAVINPFIYFFMSSQYKSSILHMFGRQKKV